MNAVKLAFLFLSLSQFCLAQGTLVPVTFIIEDADTHKEVVSALVTVRQIALTQPTLANGKVKFENVPVGEIEYYISKEDFQFKTGRMNVSSDSKTNNFRISISRKAEKMILVTGEVTDADGRDLKDATVEVKIADQVKLVLTDASGNYSVNISPSANFHATTLRIEVKKGGQELTEIIDIPITNVIYKDFQFKSTAPNGINEEASLPRKSIETKNFVSWQFSLIGCSLSGGELVCNLKFTSKNKDRKVNFFVQGTSKLYDEFGSEYYAEAAAIGNQISGHSINKLLFADEPVDAEIVFRNISNKTTKIRRLDLSIQADDLPVYRVQFDNVPIKR